MEVRAVPHHRHRPAHLPTRDALLVKWSGALAIACLGAIIGMSFLIVDLLGRGSYVPSVGLAVAISPTVVVCVPRALATWWRANH